MPKLGAYIRTYTVFPHIDVVYSLEQPYNNSHTAVPLCEACSCLSQIITRTVVFKPLLKNFVGLERIAGLAKI